MIKLFHRVPANLTGNRLMPLNELKSDYPDVYRMHSMKYKGREWLKDRNIPFLNCLWNDVLHLTIVHPRKIKDAQVAAGFQWNPVKWFQIDPIEEGLNEENAVIWLFGQSVSQLKLKPYQYVPFNVRLLSYLTDIPTMTIEYYKNFHKEENKLLLSFYGLPHVLYKRNLDTERLQIIIT